MVGISRVYGEQQDSHSNEGFTIHSKLWEKFKDRGRYKNKKKVEKATEFVKRMKKVQEEAGAVLKIVTIDTS